MTNQDVPISIKVYGTDVKVEDVFTRKLMGRFCIPFFVSSVSLVTRTRARCCFYRGGAVWGWGVGKGLGLGWDSGGGGEGVA